MTALSSSSEGSGLFTLISTGVIRALGGHVVKVAKSAVEDVPVEDGPSDDSTIVMVGGSPDNKVMVRPFVVMVLSRDTDGRCKVCVPIMATIDPVELNTEFVGDKDVSDGDSDLVEMLVVSDGVELVDCGPVGARVGDPGAEVPSGGDVGVGVRLVDIGGKRVKVESKVTNVVASETEGKVAVLDPITTKVGYGIV